MLLQPHGFSSVLFSHADLNRTNICLGGLANGQGVQLLYLVPSQAFGLSGLSQGFLLLFPRVSHVGASPRFFGFSRCITAQRSQPHVHLTFSPGPVGVDLQVLFIVVGSSLPSTINLHPLYQGF